MPIDLHAELTELRCAILSMGAMVEQRVDHAIRALLTNDSQLARGVRKGDAEVDQMEVDIEEECLRILALSQPVAVDLRFVLAVMRMNGDLERVGDLARGIAKRANHLSKLDEIEIPSALRSMADQTREMLGGAIASFADSDAGLARRVHRADARVDDLNKEIFAWVQEEIPLHVERTEALIDVLSVARQLERISDLATNITEEVVFLVEGEVVRHAMG